VKAAAAALLLALTGVAQAHTLQFQGTFAPEAAGATGSGTLFLEYDHDGHTLFIDLTFSGLSGNTNNAHIHCCTAAPNTGAAGVALGDRTNGNNMITLFPTGVKAGTYTRVIDLAAVNSYPVTFFNNNGGTVASAEAVLIAGLTSGNAYFNIHTTAFGSGEIRTFVTAVPEPSAWLTMALGLSMVGGIARRRIAGQ